MLFTRANKCYIIAEIGQNHQGDADLAKGMISIAKECGVDCVKFQKSHLPSKFNAQALARQYDSVHAWGPTYGDHKAFLEFNEDQFQQLQSHAKQVDVDFTASAMDPVSLEFLHSLHVPFIKIGSGDAQNWPLLRRAAQLKTTLLISTGMCDIEAVKKIYETVSSVHKDFGLLHCVSAYPTPEKHLNLNVIRSYRKLFPDVSIGYSGHELGIAHSVTAYKLGSKIIERHMTLDKSWKGSDHSCSLTPHELQTLVETIRSHEESFNEDISDTLALGGYDKKIQESEVDCLAKLGKSLVAARNLEIGQILSANDIAVKVADPTGIPCGHYDSVLGKSLMIDIAQDSSIHWSDLNE